MTLGEALKSAREKNGYTLKKSAKHIGLSISYLNGLEQGHAHKPKMKYLYAAAGFYGIPIDELCIAAERIPQDVFYKIIAHPELLQIIRDHKE